MMTRPDNSNFGAAGQEPVMGTGRAAVPSGSKETGAETSAVRLFAMSVDLNGSRLGRTYQSVRVLVDGTQHTPEALRVMCAEHYAIPVEQVSEAIATTQEHFHAAA